MRHDQEFHARFSTMGDIAEEKFETWAGEIGQICDRFGHNRPQSNMFKWDAFIRYAPDFIHHDHFTEVKGCGRDGLVKIKHENLAALRQWGEHLPVWLWVYNSSTNDYGHFEITEYFMSYLANYESDRFPDNNKRYWKIPFADTQTHPWEK